MHQRVIKLIKMNPNMNVAQGIIQQQSPQQNMPPMNQQMGPSAQNVSQKD